MDFEKLFAELDSPDNLANRLVNEGVVINRVERLKTGRAGKVLGDKNIPPVCRELIAVQSVIGMHSNKELSKKYGVSEPQVGGLSNGRVNTKKYISENGETKSDVELRENLDKMLGKVRDKALDRIFNCLELMDDEKLEKANARELSQIGSNLSRIVGATMPKNDGIQQNNQFNTVIYSPETRKENTYEVVEVS